jgi:hypothetical protein
VRTAALVAGLALVVAVAWLLGARWLQPVAPSPTSSAGKQADAPRQPIAAAGPGKWFDGALIHTALLVDAQGQPVCNGALIGRQRAISVAECRAEAIIHFRNDGTRAPVRATRREHGAVAVFGFEEADPDVWPSGLAAASPGPDAAVRAFVVTEMGRNHVVSPPCRLTASPVAGQRATDCMNPGGLPGTPLYDDLGTLVALIRAPGAVLTVEQMEADLAWLGVAARTP